MQNILNRSYVSPAVKKKPEQLSLEFEILSFSAYVSTSHNLFLTEQFTSLYSHHKEGYKMKIYKSFIFQVITEVNLQTSVHLWFDLQFQSKSLHETYSALHFFYSQVHKYIQIFYNFFFAVSYSSLSKAAEVLSIGCVNHEARKE